MAKPALEQPSDFYIITSRLFLKVCRGIYLTAYLIFWKLFPPNSNGYKFIRKLVRSGDQVETPAPAVSSSKLLPFFEKITIMSEFKTQAELAQQVTPAQSAKLKFAIILDEAGSDELLRATVDSLAQQTYSNFLVILPPPALIENFAKLYPQLSFQADASNLSSCDYVLSLPAGEVMFPHALFEISKHHPAQIINFDSLYQDENANLCYWCRPYGFSPELLESANYLDHAAISAALLNELLVEDLKQEKTSSGQQRFQELLPRLVAEEALSIKHTGSFVSIKQTEYAASSEIRNRRAENKVPPPLLGDSPELVSIIIPTKNQPQLIKTCVQSILENTQSNPIEILIVDNGSDDHETLAYYQSLQSLSKIRVLAFNETFNYSRAINLGASHAKGQFILTLNNDIEIRQVDWFKCLFEAFIEPAIGIVGAMLLYPNTTIQHAGVVLDPNRLISHVFCHQHGTPSTPHGATHWQRNYLAVTGACQLFRKQLFDQLGGYDENFGLTFSDVDFCLRAIQQGYRVVFEPSVELIHRESSTRSDENPYSDILLACRKFEEILLAGDPFFSKRLTNPFNPRLRTYHPDQQTLMKIRLQHMLKR